MGEAGGVHWQPHQRNGVAVALVVASLGCATTYPRTVDPEAERAKVMAYLAKRKVNPDTLVVYLKLIRFCGVLPSVGGGFQDAELQAAVPT